MVTDAALMELSKHPELEELDLRETAITDDGLQVLKVIAGLRRLDLRGTAVSEAAIKGIARSLPRCAIVGP